MTLKLKDGEYYWLDAPALSENDPICIGQFAKSGTTNKWLIGGQLYTAGTGIDVIKHIPKPKL